MSDRELATHLDDPDDWLVLDGWGQPLARSITLRHALHRVRLLLTGGIKAESLMRDSEQPLFVGMDQLYRMYDASRD
jgi:hypothetical protein